jgi:MarR family 2-MHQ and catechol resistance regulon transcriptional repressor
MRQRITQRGRTLRAFRTYLDVLDAADSLKRKMRGPLESFDLTMPGFRVLELLYQQGRVYMSQGAEELGWTKENMHQVVMRLEERGWVQREEGAQKSQVKRESQIPLARRARERKGLRVMILSLTPAGEKFIGAIFPKHAKVVKSLMRVLTTSEQATLSKLCRRVKEGDPVKFIREIIMQETWEQDIERPAPGERSPRRKRELACVTVTYVPKEWKPDGK